MARRRVKLAYIINQARRRATFKKRKNGLLKKIGELCVLCGIEACTIIYGENEQEAEVWPSTPGTRRVLARFMSLPELERRKNMLDLEGFLTKSIAKTQEACRKQMEENKKKEMSILISQFIHTGEYNLGANANLKDLNDLTELIDNNLKDVEQRIASMDLEVEQETGYRTEPMNAGVQGLETNMNHAGVQGLETGMNNADVQGLETNINHVGVQGPETSMNNAGVQGSETSMNHAMPTHGEHWPIDFPMLPFSDANMDTNGFWSI
ncbi:agamous-like MADS-box protein AGL80 [Cicer arietinum]|uniref:Agamous-like MADS-box protein AGL80 n=1 Tax=Cicer arietinum TaxID=3827 RepID=A0A1S2Y8C0_CICAR|nr:agamous-like MADS-box protein AGL80 [Cicer arietinum]